MILQRYLSTLLPSDLSKISVLNEESITYQNHFKWYVGENFVAVDEHYCPYSLDFFHDFMKSEDDSLTINTSVLEIFRKKAPGFTINANFGSRDGAIFKLIDILNRETSHVFYSVPRENVGKDYPMLALTFSSVPPRDKSYCPVPALSVNLK